MWKEVSSSFLQTRRFSSRIRGSYPFRTRARCTASLLDDLSTPRRLAAARAMENSHPDHYKSDIVFDAGLPQRGRRGRLATPTRDISDRLLEERPRKHQGPSIPQTVAQNLASLHHRGSCSQPGPDPLSQAQTHQYPVKAARSSPLTARHKDPGHLSSPISPQRSNLEVDDTAMDGAAHLPEHPTWGIDGFSTSTENIRRAAATALSQTKQQQRSGGVLTPSPPPLVPSPMGGGMGPPADSVMSGWTLAGGQPQMNSVYRLIRKKELQHNYQHLRHSHQYVKVVGAGDSDDGGGESQRSVPGVPVPLRQRQPVRGSHGNRDVSPRLGDVHRHRQVPPVPPKLPPQPQPARLGDAQHGQRQGDASTSESHLGSRSEISPYPPPAPASAAATPPLVVPFTSGHAAVDRVVRIRQIEMQRRQRRWNMDGVGVGDGSGGVAAAGIDSDREYSSRQANGRSPAGVGTRPTAASSPTYMAPMTREGVWAIDKVPTALLGGRAGAVWGHGWNEGRPNGSGGIGGVGDKDVIEVMLASPSGDGDGDGGSGGGSERGGSSRGGNDGEGNSVSSLLRETLISDLSLLNPVYRMIRKHELLQRHPHPGASKGLSSCNPTAAGASSSPFMSSPASSIDPWATDDFADVMLGGLMLAPPLPAPSASDLESTSESGSGSISGFGFAEALSGTTNSSRHATTDTAGAVPEPGRLNPVLRLIRKKQLQRRLRLRGRLGPEVPILAAAPLSSLPTAGASVSVAAADGSGDGAKSHASRPLGGSRTGSGSSYSGDTAAEATAWEIGPEDAVGGRAVLNPVYRLIRKKQLQCKRASREASAAAAAAAVDNSGSRSGSPGADEAANLPPFSVVKVAGNEATTWLPRRAPFFDLGLGDNLYGSFRSPASTLADALDPMDARSGYGSQPGSGSQSDSMAASRNELGVVIQIDNAEAAVAAAEPREWPPPLLGSRVSDQLTSSMVGERPHMNHVYRLIRKKELQLRQRGVLPHAAPAAGPVEGSTSTAHRDDGAGGGGSAAADASITNGGSASVLLPLPLMAAARPAASVRPSSSSSGPPALLHPFDPVDDQDGGSVPGRGAVRVLTGYSRRLLMGRTYDEEQDEVYSDVGDDDEGTFWSATSEEDSWDELADDHEEALSSSRIAGIGLASLALGPCPEAKEMQPEAVVERGLRAGAVDMTEIHMASDAPEKPQGLVGQCRGWRRKQNGRRVTVSDEEGGEREETGLVVQDSGLAVRGEEHDGKESTVAAAAAEAENEDGGKGQSQQRRLHPSHEAIPTGSAVAATAMVTGSEDGLECTSTARQHATGRRGRGRRTSTGNDQDASLVVAGKALTVAAETNFVAAASITKIGSSSNGPQVNHGDGVFRADVSRGEALISPRRRRIEQLKASLRTKLLRLATTGPGPGAGVNMNRPLSLLSGAPSDLVSEPSQRHYHSAPLSPPASMQAAALAVPSIRNKESATSAETAAAGAGSWAGAIGAARGAAAPTTKDITYSTSITAASKAQASRSDAEPVEVNPEREVARDPAVAAAVTARPLPWQLARRGSAATRDSVSSIASVSSVGRSRFQIRRTGSAHRPPGLLRFLLETSPGPDGAEFSYGTQAALQSTRGLPDSSDGGDGVSSTAVRAPRQLFSGIAQLWDAVGLRVGPLPPALPHVDLDAMAATAATSVRDFAQLEKLLIQEGVSETTARRLSASWLVQSRGWEPENVVERLRGLQRVLAWPAPSSVPHARAHVSEGTGAVPLIDAQYTPVPECSHEAHQDKPGAGAAVDWPRAGAGGGRAAAATIITAESGIAVAAAAAAKQPNLLTRDPAVLETNLGMLATTLRMDRHGAQKLVRTWPSLLELRPESL
ncbi:hypothetical protein VaNZ11_002306, partial [Volvox africanus]